jgi:glutamate N-acetyltransferase / amino-acid N-acetyltransferase
LSPAGEEYLEVVEAGTATSPLGFRAGAVACGLKQSNNLDLALLVSDRECEVAGLFTRNQVAAAPVMVDRETLAGNRRHIRGVVANAGNANACTGAVGLANAREMQARAARLLGWRPEQMLVLSTGVIGVRLDMARVASGLRIVSKGLSPEGGLDAARAIMTTDTRPKHLAVRLRLPEGVITIGGMAKGSGMIHPNMATMLAVITTDARVEWPLLQEMLQAAAERSFHAISVDGDTSTNDTVLLLANGASGVDLEDPRVRERFAAGVGYVCQALAKMVVRDGEGASRFVKIAVTGAADETGARQVAATIATSPLVKTALAGGDPNWGRILAAAGRSGISFDQNRVGLWIGGPEGSALQLVDGGTPTSYAEEDAAHIFAQPEIHIRLDLGQGRAETRFWTTDLTHAYVTINADYRT